MRNRSSAAVWIDLVPVLGWGWGTPVTEFYTAGRYDWWQNFSWFSPHGMARACTLIGELLRGIRGTHGGGIGLGSSHLPVIKINHRPNYAKLVPVKRASNCQTVWGEKGSDSVDTSGACTATRSLHNMESKVTLSTGNFHSLILNCWIPLGILSVGPTPIHMQPLYIGL